MTDYPVKVVGGEANTPQHLPLVPFQECSFGKGDETSIARAKANGICVGKGRPASIDAARVREMKSQGLGATAIAKELGIGRASVYRML